MDTSGNLYGTASGGGASGGASNNGTVFQVVKGSQTITALASFNGLGTDGAIPYGGLIRDSSGNLYGTTEAGGVANSGTVFELTGAAAPTKQGMPPIFDTSTDQPTGAAEFPAMAQRMKVVFEPLLVIGQQMDGKKLASIGVEPVKPYAGILDREAGLLPAENMNADIDQLFAGEWSEWQVVSR
jgi:uncharacterized repeat protein (TIGR03803 family)